MELYDTVELAIDLPAASLQAGAVGAVVHIFHEPNLAYEVEFADEDGRTLAMVPLTPDQIRPHD